MNGTIPTIENFNPTLIPFQYDVIKKIRQRNYKTYGPIEILLSGAVGSSKTLLMAHIAVTHCLFNPGALILVGRKALPQLKDTILKMIIDHLGLDIDFSFNSARGIIKFSNGSEIIPISWADGHYTKVRSYNASAAIIEEATENAGMEYLKEIKMRIGRIFGIKEKFIILATNPDSPSHPLYDYFIGNNTDPNNRVVYYSKSEDNPFLDPMYIQSIKSTLTERESRRMLYGEWLEIRTDCIYYAFDEKLHIDKKIESTTGSYPIIISFDFNIGINKPFSIVIVQYDGHNFYAIDEIVIEGINTDQVIDELLEKPYIKNHKIIIRGDAAGNARSTKSYGSDYDIIRSRLRSSGLNFEIDVPNFNPSIRDRHIKVNGCLKNALGEIRIKISPKCKMLIKGLKLARLKENGQYIENDDDPWQHITTAFGYCICRQLDKDKQKNSFKMGAL